MTFDNTCKFIAENFSQDIATWLLGRSIFLTKLGPSEVNALADRTMQTNVREFITR